MERALTLSKTTIGKKIIMAISGMIWMGFAIGHLSGNLLAFSGPKAFNEYAGFLRDTPALLWGTRFALLFATLAHVGSALALWNRNKEARPSRYKKTADRATDFAAKTMYWTGPVLLFYILFHLVHLTLGGAIFGDASLFGIEGYTFSTENPYNNMVYGFQHWIVVVPYILGVCALGMHLFHGFSSMFQTLGANHPKYNAIWTNGAPVLAALITAGFLSIPAAVQAELITPDVGNNHPIQVEVD